VSTSLEPRNAEQKKTKQGILTLKADEILLQNAKQAETEGRSPPQLSLRVFYP